MIEYLTKQINWSRRIFGTGRRTLGIIKHIQLEFSEIMENPNDFKEWIDVVILALDGAWRAGATPRMIVDRLKEKQEINFGRNWPNVPADDEVSEHIE